MKNLLLKPLSVVFSKAVDVRGWFYRTEFAKAKRVRVPVISVGNITVGGTGKTPFVDLIVKYLLSKNQCVGLVSRGYGAAEKKQGIIDFQNTDFSEMASQFGDEPTMLQWKNPNLSVCVNSNRYLACQDLIEKRAVGVIVADDAFQHLALKRDLDIVLLDATAAISDFQMLPLGRLREQIAALRRADLVILNKVNLATPDKVQVIRAMVIAENPTLKNDNSRWLEANYDFDGFVHLESGLSWSKGESDKFIMVAAIANNESFFKMCRDRWPQNACGEIGFADHHNYSDSDVAKIMNRAKQLGADRILITEKDAVKISKWKSDIFVYSKLQVSLVGDGRSLYDKIDKIIS